MDFVELNHASVGTLWSPYNTIIWPAAVPQRTYVLKKWLIMLYTNLRPCAPIPYTVGFPRPFPNYALLSVGGFPIDQDMDDPVVALWRQGGSGHG